MFKKELVKINQKYHNEKLHFLPFNRAYKVTEALIHSMNLYGFIVPILLLYTDIIDGVKRLYVVDGQHRLATAMYLGIDAMGYIINPETEIKTQEDLVKLVAMLNSSTSPWVNINYVTAFAFLGFQDYRTLLVITGRSPYSVTTIAHLLYGVRSKGNWKSSGAFTRNLRNGKFRVNNLEETEYVLKLAAKLSKFEKVTSRMLLAMGYVSSMRSFNEAKFVKNYEMNATKVKELKLDDYSDIFAQWSK